MTGKGPGYRSELSRVRGLGAAREGVRHWWAQRLTSLALVPLSLWFVAAVVAHLGADRAEMVAWLSRPYSFGVMALLIGVTFHHAQLGLQVVIEDYVHAEGCKIAAIVAVKFAAAVLALAALVALFAIAFQG